MSKLDRLYEFRLATPADIDAIMAFYKREWNRDHILANDREFFCYQHQVDDRINFMLALNRETGEIEGAEGFVQYSKELLDIGPVMWKVSSQARIPLLGIEVVKRLRAATQCRSYLGFGANPNTSYRLHETVFKLNVGKTDHYYMLADRDTYRVASIVEKKLGRTDTRPPRLFLRPLANINELDRSFDYGAWADRRPFKDSWYLNRRYFEHPIYTYKAFAVEDGQGQTRSAIFSREVFQNNAKILRIVDIVGATETIAELGSEMQRMLREHHYEYIDIYCKGVDKSLFLRGGFAHKDENDPNIIPNFFDPFLQKNIDILYAVPDGNVILFKGDGDQDRPNRRLGADLA